MFELVRRHCFALVIGILVWQGWSRTQAAEPSAAAGGEPLPSPQRIEPRDVPRRGVEVTPADLKDPFFLVELLQMKAETEAARSGGNVSSRPGASSNGVDVNAGPGVPVLRVTLQSTMPGDPGRAWINGADLLVGDVVPGADETEPPVLIAVSGTNVSVMWRGKRFRIDLDGSAPVEEEI